MLGERKGNTCRDIKNLEERSEAVTQSMSIENTGWSENTWMGVEKRRPQTWTVIDF